MKKRRERADPDAPPYMVFTEDGYRWGPGHPTKAGEKPYWQTTEPASWLLPEEPKR